MKPLVSILIPAFNAEAFLADTLRSALAQNWPRKEIIVVDDGSKDGTLSIAKRFESEGIHVVTQSHQGASVARNWAFELSHGQYIQWLDADDLLAPDKIENQMRVAERCPGSRMLLSGAWGSFMYRPRKAKFIPTSLWCDLAPVEWLCRKWEGNVWMQTATWLVSRELAEAAGPWDTRLLRDNDGEYFCRILLASQGTRFVPEAIVLYRRLFSNSLSYIGLSAKKLEATWLSHYLQIQRIRSVEDSPRVRVACIRLLQTSLCHYYPSRPDLIRQTQRLAEALGARLNSPCFAGKYKLLQVLFGKSLTKRISILFPRVRKFPLRFWDRALGRLGSGIERWPRANWGRYCFVWRSRSDGGRRASDVQEAARHP